MKSTTRGSSAGAEGKFAFGFHFINDMIYSFCFESFIIYFTLILAIAVPKSILCVLVILNSIYGRGNHRLVILVCNIDRLYIKD